MRSSPTEASRAGILNLQAQQERYIMKLKQHWAFQRPQFKNCQ